MSNAKVVMGQAANTLTAPLEVEDVFSTYLYTGTGSTQTITNGIDLDGEGGLTWIKKRNSATNSDHMLFDTERGVNNRLRSNTTDQAYAVTQQLNSFNSNGFTLGTDSPAAPNVSGDEYASWTFRKAPKFFDVVTYTGDGAVQAISHNLGSVPGFIAVKQTSGANPWMCYHRSTGATEFLELNSVAASAVNNTAWNDTEPTSTEFTLGYGSYGNTSGQTYVAYLFAHNDGDGGFNGGDIIKCGSYTGNNGQPHHVELGFEPQWLLVKNADLSTGGAWWSVVDVQRGMLADTSIKVLKANESEAEINENGFTPTATGFTVSGNNDFQNNSTNTYIYIAIRRGTKVPESATEVFEPTAYTGDGTTNRTVGSLTVDMNIIMDRTKTSSLTYNPVWSRVTGSDVAPITNTADVETTGWTPNFYNLDQQNGFSNGTNTGFLNNSGSSYISYIWKRAPNFFDVVAYTGDGVAGRTVSHNLGVAPEMMWVKRRDSAVNWPVYAAPLGATKRAFLNLTNAFATDSTYWNNTEPTSTEFTVGTYIGANASGGEYIAYLFSSLAGISKVGSYTGNGGSQTIDCGFTSGARFVLIRASNSVSNWYVFDTERGIVVGNDPYLSLNTTNAEQAGYDHLTPDSSGFTVTSSDFNANGQPYLFYAIA